MPALPGRVTSQMCLVICIGLTNCAGFTIKAIITSTSPFMLLVLSFCNLELRLVFLSVVLQILYVSFNKYEGIKLKLGVETLMLVI